VKRFLKVVDDNQVPAHERQHDVTWKIKPLIDCVRFRCLKLIRPTSLCIDEQMIPFTGRCPIKQFIRGKPNPEGLKVLAERKGIVYDFFIYQGKNRNISSKYSQFNQGEVVVLHAPSKSNCPQEVFYLL
jgi:hypothetical protein